MIKNKEDYLEVFVISQPDKLHFWLPQNVQVGQIIEGIVSHNPFPRSKLKPQAKYAFKDETGKTLEDSQALRFQGVRPASELRLVQIDLPIIELHSLKGSHFDILLPDMIIGYSRNNDKPDIDLSNYIAGSNINVDEISRNHGQILLDNDNRYVIRVLHPNGISANGRYYEQGEIIILEDRMRLLFGELSVQIRFDQT